MNGTRIIPSAMFVVQQYYLHFTSCRQVTIKIKLYRSRFWGKMYKRHANNLGSNVFVRNGKLREILRVGGGVERIIKKLKLSPKPLV